MSDLFNTYKNRSNDASYSKCLRALHRAWYNGQPFASIEAMEKFLSSKQLDPKFAREIWHSNSNKHISWKNERTTKAAKEEQR